MSDTPQTQRPEPFDVRACAILREAHAVIYAQCPEVRSIGSTLDYFGHVNDANVQKGIWSSENGPVQAVDAIFGSMFQTMRLLENQFSAAVEVAAAMRAEAEALASANIELRKEREAIQEEIAACRSVRDGIPADGAGS